MDSASPFLSCLIWALLTAAALASQPRGRFIRNSFCVGSVSLFVVLSAFGVIPPLGSFYAWLLIAILMTIASIGPANPRSSFAAFAFSGFVLLLANPTPITWLGLVHQLALLDLASCSAVTVTLLLLGNGIPPKVETGCAGIQRGPLANLPCAIFLRNSLMLLTLIAAWILALLTSEGQFERTGILGIWTAISEVIAAFVAWQIIRGGTRPKALVATDPEKSVDSEGVHPKCDSAQSSEKSPGSHGPEHEASEVDRDLKVFEPRWNYKIAFIVAGISSTVALLLVPLILSVASELDW